VFLLSKSVYKFFLKRLYQKKITGKVPQLLLIILKTRLIFWALTVNFYFKGKLTKIRTNTL